ncbi:MAG TPA: (2Fe-2S)-binding protein [Minicystis sp.]|nr:(2Fe-2S)-binding protein [Minicystis sp.]
MFNINFVATGRMYVCLCTGVTDHDIQKAVDGGACTPAEVMACTGAGTRCGTCRPTVAALVAARLAKAEAAPSSGRRALEVLPDPVLAQAV